MRFELHCENSKACHCIAKCFCVLDIISFYSFDFKGYIYVTNLMRMPTNYHIIKIY